MKLIDALEELKKPLAENAPCFHGALACGFTPLHFETFLGAHLRKRLPGKRVCLETGLFGDLPGNLGRLHKAPTEVLVVIIEWQDVDPRLGIRTLGGWRTTDLPDIVNSTAQALGILQTSIVDASAVVPVCVSTPTLPLPPLFMTSPQQASTYELQLRELTASFSSAIAAQPNVRVVSYQLLDELSPACDRFDLKSEVQTGFPYQLSHASSLAKLIADIVAPSTRKKAIITDLDDTLWGGILGEQGPEGISWGLDHGTHLHGIYQQFLESVASAGILLAVASKNELELVNRAFERADLRVSKDNIYPFEVHWSPKSESVGRILEAWNIGAEDVIFLDDSPIEVAEVKNAYPEMECLVFPKADYEAFWELLKHLRRDFGKMAIDEEDSIRTKSIREGGALRNEMRSGSLDDFLRSAAAWVRVEFTRGGRDSRAFELVNKTNQFNLNGKRWTQAAWSSYFADPDAFLMTVKYEDRYGPLGKIAAVLGRVHGKTVEVDTWVMSCRAFSRRIEHQTLKQIFEKFRSEEIVFDYQPTPRNAPLQEFFMEMLGAHPHPGDSLSFAEFSNKSLEIFQRVEEVVNG